MFGMRPSAPTRPPLGQGVVQVRLDHVLDADQAGAGGRAIIQQALAHVLGQVAAVVVRLDDAC